MGSKFAELFFVSSCIFYTRKIKLRDIMDTAELQLSEPLWSQTEGCYRQCRITLRCIMEHCEITLRSIMDTGIILRGAMNTAESHLEMSGQCVMYQQIQTQRYHGHFRIKLVIIMDFAKSYSELSWTLRITLRGVKGTIDTHSEVSRSHWITLFTLRVSYGFTHRGIRDTSKSH
jgi:hypothetical protein